MLSNRPAFLFSLLDYYVSKHHVILSIRMSKNKIVGFSKIALPRVIENTKCAHKNSSNFWNLLSWKRSSTYESTNQAKVSRFSLPLSQSFKVAIMFWVSFNFFCFLFSQLHPHIFLQSKQSIYVIECSRMLCSKEIEFIIIEGSISLGMPWHFFYLIII